MEIRFRQVYTRASLRPEITGGRTACPLSRRSPESCSVCDCGILRYDCMRTRAGAILTFALLLALTYRGYTQPQTEPQADRFRRMSLDAESRGLAERFKGITTNGVVQPGLYTIRSTGVATEPVRKAAAAFLAALLPEQRKKTTFAVDDVEWRKWMNQDFYIRQGVSFKEMSEPQREAAFGLMRASLSAKGLQLSRDIMRLNYTLGELNHNDFVRYGEWAYWITMMG